MPSTKVQFTNKNGYRLSAKIDFPLDQKPEAYALFAHVFTGHKNLIASKHISRALTLNGIAVLRFDFTGLGESEGDFADTNFTSNVEDLLAACKFLTVNYVSPSIIIGHSLGGAASIYAASKIESVRAVATIGAPSEPEHVTHLLENSIEEIKSSGKAKVNIGGRHFTIKRQFLEDLQSKNMYGIIKNLNKALLVLHSPQDRIVEIENAAKIYHSAYHPKSFITLDGADHMLTDKDDAFYAGNVISSWVKRYIDRPEVKKLHTHKDVVALLGKDGYTTDIRAGQHGLIADESEDLGGNDFGPSPYEYLNAALGACTAMTLQMYARRKKWDLQEVKVHLSFSRSYREDCEHCDVKDRRLEEFDREVEITGNLEDSQISRLMEIADRCPVHRTLAANSTITTRLLTLDN
jgi:putative redox protein